MIYFSRPTELNSNVNYGLWTIMMNQCKFISCNKCISLWGILIMGDVVHLQGLGDI